MDQEIKQFIEENINLIQSNKWEEIYEKLDPEGRGKGLLFNSYPKIGKFTEAMLQANIDPIYESDLTYIPDNYLIYQKWVEVYNIPYYIKSIGANAFNGCENLKITELPQDIVAIKTKAFAYCTNMKGNFKIPKTCVSIGPSAFDHCNNINIIVIEDNGSNLKIYSGAFAYCSNLKSIKIPNRVYSIGEYAFTGCESLTNIVLGNGINEALQNYMFIGCKNLDEITYLGTQKEAINILKVKNKRWRLESAIKQIICTDGIIEL